MEAELVFALLLAHLRRMKPRHRAAFLREVCAITASWETDAHPLRGDGVRGNARKAAAAWVRDNLPRLMT